MPSDEQTGPGGEGGEQARDAHPRSEPPSPHGDPMAPESPAPTPEADPALSDAPRPQGDPADELP